MRAVVIGGLVGLAAAAPASAAFAPPTISVRLALSNSIDHSGKSDWMGLAATPTLNWLGGYEIGYVVQDTGTSNQLQKVALQILSVPDGHVDQGPGLEPFCSGKVTQVGQIVPVAPALQYEGNGTYTVRVSIGPASGGSTDCMVPGPNTASTTASFNVGVSVVPELVGRPQTFRAKRRSGDQFVGVRAADPPGGEGRVQCARDAKVNADGSVTGKVTAPGPDDSSKSIDETGFTRPGAWTCVARGDAPHVDSSSSTKPYGTPWSAPLRFDVHSDFRRARGLITGAHSRRPKIAFTAEFPEAAAGGRLSFRFREVDSSSCRRTGPRTQTYRYKSNATYKATFTSKTATVTLRTPAGSKAKGIRYYLGTVSFGGTHYINRSTDPNLSYLKVTDRGVLSFVAPNRFPLC